MAIVAQQKWQHVILEVDALVITSTLTEISLIYAGTFKAGFILLVSVDVRFWPSTTVIVNIAKRQNKWLKR